jgi:hypothetical protein
MILILQKKYKKKQITLKYECDHEIKIILNIFNYRFKIY